MSSSPRRRTSFRGGLARLLCLSVRGAAVGTALAVGSFTALADFRPSSTFANLFSLMAHAWSTMATMSSICVGSCCVARRRPRIATGVQHEQRRSKATQSSMSAGHGYWGTRGRRCVLFSRVPPRHHHQCPRMLRRRRRQRRGLRAHGAPRLCVCGIRARALSPCPGRIHSSVQAAISHLAPHLVTAGQTALGRDRSPPQTAATKIWMAAFTARSRRVTGTELLQWLGTTAADWRGLARLSARACSWWRAQLVACPRVEPSVRCGTINVDLSYALLGHGDVRL